MTDENVAETAGKNSGLSPMKKVVLYAAALGAILYGGDRLDVAKKLSGAYGGAKDFVVDVLTIDAGEAAREFVKQVEEEKNPGKYTGDLAQAIYVASDALDEEIRAGTIGELLESVPDSLAEPVITDRVLGMDTENQLKVVENAGKSLLKNKTDEAKDKFNELYNKIKRLYRNCEQGIGNMLHN